MEEKNKGLQRHKYEADFKIEVLKMVASDQTVAYVSQALGVSTENIRERESCFSKRFYLAVSGELAVERTGSAARNRKRHL